MKIQSISSNSIDVSKWNACVKASDGKIYNRFEYVDTLSPHWMGLVYGDYDYILAVPYVLKYGVFKIALLPSFIQSLEICGTKNIDSDILNLFAKALQQYFRLIFTNSQQHFQDHFSSNVFSCQERINFKIPIAAVVHGERLYTKSCRKHIRHAEMNQLTVGTISVAKVIAFYKAAYGSVAHYQSKDYEKISILIQKGLEMNFCQLFGVYSSDGQLINAAAIFYDAHSAYYILAAPNLLGKKLQSPSFLIDYLVRNTFSDLQYFDLEGSMLPNVGKFYRSFNPEIERYYSIVLNQWPQPLKWLINKKLFH